MPAASFLLFKRPPTCRCFTCVQRRRMTRTPPSSWSRCAIPVSVRLMRAPPVRSTPAPLPGQAAIQRDPPERECTTAGIPAPLSLSHSHGYPDQRDISVGRIAPPSVIFDRSVSTERGGMRVGQDRKGRLAADLICIIRARSEGVCLLF